MWPVDEARIRGMWNPENPDDLAWFRLNSICSQAKEKYLLHNHADPNYMQQIQDPTKLATVNNLVTIYDQIASATLPITDDQKAGWITAFGGQEEVLSQDHNWLWEVGAY